MARTAVEAPRSAAPRPRAKPSTTQEAARPPGIAFFDFDNTLMQGDAGPLFGWYIFRWRRHELTGRPIRRLRLWARYIPFAFWMGIEALFYAIGAVRRSTLVRASYKGLRGVPAATFYHLMADFAREIIVPRLYPSMVAELRSHLQAGRRCVVVTTGMEALVRHVLDTVDPRIDLIGCRLRERKGKISGHVQGPLYGVDKANILHAYARALRVATDACWAYSDHWSDKQMLEAVGHPVAVNPRGRLARKARRQGWRVVRAEAGATG